VLCGDDGGEIMMVPGEIGNMLSTMEEVTRVVVVVVPPMSKL